MRLRTALVLAFAVAACGSNTATLIAVPTAPPLLPLPANLSGVPGPPDVTAVVEPHSPAGELRVGVSTNFRLGHCGLASPVDIDGSLWDPIGLRIAGGGAFTTQHEGELINSTLTVAVLSDANTLELHTGTGLVIVLQRHEGPRRYFLCD